MTNIKYGTRFGGFIGAGLRYYMYKPYTKNGKTVVTAIGMILISNSGISLLSIFVVLNVLQDKRYILIIKSLLFIKMSLFYHYIYF